MSPATLILATAVMCFFPIGMKFISGEGEILERFGNWMRNTVVTKAPKWMQNPLWICPRCMVSLWGTPAALFVVECPTWWCLPVLLVTAVGAQDLFDR